MVFVVVSTGDPPIRHAQRILSCLAWSPCLHHHHWSIAVSTVSMEQQSVTCFHMAIIHLYIADCLPLVVLTKAGLMYRGKEADASSASSGH